jgi:hypothetical protein
MGARSAAIWEIGRLAREGTHNHADLALVSDHRTER